MTSVPPSHDRAPEWPRSRSIECHWLEYREAAVPQDCSPADLRRLRLAFYSAASALLAEAVVRSFDPDALEAMSDEIKAFLVDVAASDEGER